MRAGLAGSSARLGGACFVRAAAGFVPALLREQSPVSAGGNRGEGVAGLSFSRVSRRAEPQAALAGTGAFLPQAERSVETGCRAGPAEGDLREASFQLPAGTKPALKGSVAEDSCPSRAMASKQPGTMWEGKQGHQRGGRGHGLSPVFHQGASCTPCGARRGSWPGQCSRALVGCLHVCGASRWEGRGGGRVEAAALAGHHSPPML